MTVHHRLVFAATDGTRWLALILIAFAGSVDGANVDGPERALAASPSRTRAVRRFADQLFFDSDRTGNFEIYTMNVDGSNVRPVTNDARFDSWWPRLSPDRREILFYRTPKGVHDRDYGQTNLWTMRADGSDLRELRPARTDGWDLQGHGEWSPDGTQLVMFGGRQTNPQIYVTTSSGTTPRQITSRAGTNIDPSWSRDGKSIIFVGCPAATCFPSDYEIYTVPVDASAPATRLTFDTLRDHDPYDSPDGRQIAWLTQTSTAGPVGVWNIRIAAADGTQLRPVTNDTNVNSKPEWSRDGRLIYFHRLELGGQPKFDVFSIRPDGTALTKITAGQPGSNEFPSN